MPIHGVRRVAYTVCLLAGTVFWGILAGGSFSFRNSRFIRGPFTFDDTRLNVLIAAALAIWALLHLALLAATARNRSGRLRLWLTVLVIGNTVVLAVAGIHSLALGSSAEVYGGWFVAAVAVALIPAILARQRIAR
jgi:succinate-acetate transporter protein